MYPSSQPFRSVALSVAGLVGGPATAAALVAGLVVDTLGPSGTVFCAAAGVRAATPSSAIQDRVAVRHERDVRRVAMTSQGGGRGGAGGGGAGAAYFHTAGGWWR